MGCEGKVPLGELFWTISQLLTHFQVTEDLRLL